ncbi:thiamine pyrophosphate-dependent enzyme [Arthrobacter roseus]|uniref:thiamine pyrophosphate-dependent enzyme n=1 Tax=Arthrobacter roseus TaxID=136274 RepID=UPI0019664FFB|nr:thiamine pyrophosphate-dependent enzyme [Arthrobacter roseus]MBM7847906.1 acetolactate synthase-1/2/3 large subunit [Arthrobacter roseus]
MPQSAGHLIVRELEAHGVLRVYSVPGESFLDVLDGLYDSPIETVVARHEGGAGFMALAEGRLTGTPGIAMVTRGPGAANAMISVHTAWQDATAIVLFVGLIPVADRGRDSFQEFNLSGWFGTTAKKVLMLDDEHRAAEVVADAMRTAASGRPGPVVVGLPEDVLRRMTDAEPVAPLPVAPVAVADTLVQDAATRLAEAKKPLVIVGGDGWDGDAGSRLMRWAEASHIPVASDWRAHDAVPQDSTAWAGWLGYGRADTLAAQLDEADLLLFIGCGRSDVMSDSYTRGFDVETILVLPDPDAVMHAGRIDLQIVATPASFVAALPSADSIHGDRDAQWMTQLAHDQQRYATTGTNDGPMDLTVAFQIMDRVVPEERVVTYGAGNATLWGHRYLSHNVPHSLVGSRNGAMGAGVPAVVAASLIFPQRQSVAICGDGDFLMNPQEITAAFAYGTAPLIVVVDNGIYATIAAHQRLHYPGRPSGTAATNPNFAALMRSFGGHGETVEATADVEAALLRALASGVPSLLHILLDPEILPPSSANTIDQGVTA